MTRADVTQRILSAKRMKGLTWKQALAEIGHGASVYVAAGLMGQMTLRPE